MIDELAPKIVPVVLANITTRYPYHDSHVMLAGEAPRDPVAAHSAFGNSYDWHSSAHSHWTAIALLEHFATRGKPPGIAALQHAVLANLRPEHIETESAYLRDRPSYERPYGWAWAMMLAASAVQSKNSSVRECVHALRGLAEQIATIAINWMEMLPMPIRHGVHSNTAFALGLMHDAAQTLGMKELNGAILSRARDWYATDRNWPERYERSGSDFLSPGLAEADLMRRVLPANEFATWWTEFLPSLSDDAPILLPVRVPVVEDGHVVHLHGLNFSRAASLARIGKSLQLPEFFERARALYDASIDRVVSGFYTETHWLPTFAWDAATAIDAGQQMING